MKGGFSVGYEWVMGYGSVMGYGLWVMGYGWAAGKRCAVLPFLVLTSGLCYYWYL